LGEIIQWVYDLFHKVQGPPIFFIFGVISDVINWLYNIFTNPESLKEIGIFFSTNLGGIYGMWLEMFGGGGTTGPGVDMYGNPLTPRNAWDLTGATDKLTIADGHATGGAVSQTGIAKIHKGETIVPAGKGGVTVNITGQFKSDEDMYRRFVDRLRQEQWRTNI